MMCEHKHHPPHSGGFTSGVLFGALLGLAAGVLLAPAKGEDTRKKIQNAKEDYAKKAGSTVEQIQQLFAEDALVETAETLDKAPKKRKLFKGAKKS